MKPGMTIVPVQSTTSRIAGGEVWADGCDRLAVDQDVGLFEVADLRVEAEHDAAAQQHTPFAIRDDSLRRHSTRRWPIAPSRPAGSGRQPRRGGGKEGPTRGIR